MRHATASAIVLGVLVISGCDRRSESEKYLDSLPPADRTRVLEEGMRKAGIVEAARRACAVIISRESGGSASDFSPANSGTGDDEFYLAWPAGQIQGGRREKPDLMTGSWLPSGMCIGSISQRKITSLTVNGNDIIADDQPTKF